MTLVSITHEDLKKFSKKHQVMDSIAVIARWCRFNCKGRFKFDINVDHGVWAFSDPREAMLFKLTWGGK